VNHRRCWRCRSHARLDEKFHEFSHDDEVSLICNRAESTLSPIPVRLRSLITALFFKRIFKVLEKISVPREEPPRKVDLFIELENGSTENIKLTLRLRSICKYTMSRQNESILMNGELRSSPTVIERTGFVYGRDQRNIRWNRRLQPGIMGEGGKALKVRGQHHG
jgi:hypothetical protein